MQRYARTVVLTAILSGAALAPPAFAADGGGHRSEALGFGGGAAFGALVAGPPGAILGAIRGGLFDRYRQLEKHHHHGTRSTGDARGRIAGLRRRVGLVHRVVERSAALLLEPRLLGFHLLVALPRVDRHVTLPSRPDVAIVRPSVAVV